MLIIHRTEPCRVVEVPDDTPRDRLASAYPEREWLVDPSLLAVAGIPRHYWKVVGDLVLPMVGAETLQADEARLSALRREAHRVLERCESRRRSFQWDGDEFRLEIGPLMVQMLADEAGWEASTCVSLADGRITEIPRERFREFTATAFSSWQKWRERVLRVRDMIARAVSPEALQHIIDSLREGQL